MQKFTDISRLQLRHYKKKKKFLVIIQHTFLFSLVKLDSYAILTIKHILWKTEREKEGDRHTFTPNYGCLDFMSV